MIILVSLLIKAKYNLIKSLKLYFKNKCCSKSEFETLILLIVIIKLIEEKLITRINFGEVTLN